MKKTAPDKTLRATSFKSNRNDCTIATKGERPLNLDVRKRWDNVKRKLTIEIRSVPPHDAAQESAKSELESLRVELGTMDGVEFSSGGDYPLTRNLYEKEDLLVVEFTVEDPRFDPDEAAFGLTRRSTWEKDAFRLKKPLVVEYTDEEKPAE